jgi:fatty acid desaturase
VSPANGLGEAPVPARGDYLTTAHGVVNVLHVLATHALLIAWFWLGFELLPLALYIPASAIACLVHQRSMSEWIHEGGHFNLVPDRSWNDRLTDLLTGTWIGVTADAYRSTHFPHHARRTFFVPGDPDTDFLDISNRRDLRAAVLRDLVGVTALRGFLRFGANEKPASTRIGFFARTAIVHLAVLGCLFLAGRLDAYALYYVTLLTLYPLHNRLRVYGQHVTLDPDGRSVVAKSRTSRTIDAGFFDRVFWTSPRLLYHWEHHRHPYLPYRALAGICTQSDDGNRYSRKRWAVLRAIYRGLAPA